jgi:hypothetical protein
MIMKKIEQERDQSIDPVRGDLLTSAANAVAARFVYIIELYESSFDS